ncbi:MAG: preprotein translocase subunit SecG [Chloroflexota bacterium]
MNSALLVTTLSALAMAGTYGKLKTAVLVVCCVIYGLCALMLIAIILLQESKGGGLAALGGTRAESAFGASNPLRRMTTVLSIVFLVLAGVLSLWLAPEVTKSGKKGDDKDKKPAGATEKPGDTKPVSATVDIPVGEPKKDAEPAKDAPKDTPKDAPKDAPKDSAAPAPTDKPADKPAEKPADKPAAPPAGAP